MKVQSDRVDSGDGYRLDVKRYTDPERFDPDKAPVLMIPGYCMNTFILAFHPRGRSIVEALCAAGHEVWTSNLRGQGDTEAYGARPGKVGFAQIALVDLPKVVDHVRENSASRRREPHAIGASLGGTFLFAYLAHHPRSHALTSVVGMGAPLRWVERHPLLQVAFRSSRLASVVRVSNTRAMARLALPVAKRIPGLLSMYMNTDHIDLSDAGQLTQTVDDPHPYLNVQISKWVTQQDLRVRGVNVTEALRQVRLPHFAIYANGDGIVPPKVAQSSLAVLKGPLSDSLQAGDDAVWFAHADMFINDRAETEVFEPLVSWLRRVDQGA